MLPITNTEYCSFKNAEHEIIFELEDDKLKGKILRCYVKQREVKVIVEVNQTIPISNNEGTLQAYIDMTVGAWAKNNKVLNKEEFTNWAIMEINLGPTNEEERIAWNKTINTTTNRLAPLYIVVDAYSQNEYFNKGDNRIEKLYYGGEKNNLLRMPVDNIWSDINGESFELTAL